MERLNYAGFYAILYCIIMPLSKLIGGGGKHLYSCGRGFIALRVFSDNKHKLNDKEYRRKVYTYDEIIKIIEKYGLPQDYNNDGKYGSERYVEAHIWSDETINKYRK